MNNNDKAAADQFKQLMQRPDIDEAAARYDEMYRKIREQLTNAVPSLHWEQTNPPGRAACSTEFGAIDTAGRADAQERGLGNWAAHGNLPDARWDEAVSIVGGVARSYGFNSGPTVVKNNPSDHYVTFHDSYGGELVFGTAVNTTLLVRTGCHLTAEAKKRGSLAPLPSY
ncbi:hypothetical protein GCM10022222_32310 [Amycolatopsis ultiminotia]|uniref:LppA-like lipoprotein n=1 Tax=Amycolatopsis ultiminotia TaxID=543629 RepID=A0ABP6W7B9_9PSEU